MNLIARWAACASLVLGALVPVAGPATIACADEGPRAALVVDTGDGVHRFCVKLPEASVSGLELIVLANKQHGLSYRFGHGGAAVCMLADVGTTGDDCFGSYPNFWGYWRGSSNEGWTWSSSGAGSTSVGDGDVEGWSWGSGNDGGSHPRPPATRFSSVCPVAVSSGGDAPPTSPSEGGKKPGRGSARPRPSSSGAAPAASDASNDDASRSQASADEPEREAKRRRAKSREASRKSPRPPETVRPTSEEQPSIAARPANDTHGGSGVPPASGLAALGAAALLSGAGFVLARRRRGGP